MYSLHRSCTTPLSHPARVSAFVRNCSEYLEGHVKIPEKKKLLRIYEAKELPNIFSKEPKLKVPIRPMSHKHTEETDPWLFITGVFPKSVHDFTKEQVCTQLFIHNLFIFSQHQISRARLSNSNIDHIE